MFLNLIFTRLFRLWFHQRTRKNISHQQQMEIATDVLCSSCAVAVIDVLETQALLVLNQNAFKCLFFLKRI